MRMRRKPGAEDQLQAHERVITEPAAHKGGWKDIFEQQNPLHIEIGTGKGRFITKMAEQHPSINYIGIEKEASVLISALRYLKENLISNIRFICIDVKEIEELFEPGEIERLYINFCDPWSKKRYAKRRLTYRDFLKRYEKLLSPTGEIHFKTDNQKLFEFSLNEFSDMDWKLKNITFDLHNSDFEGNIMTEYEAKFSEKGMPIYRCEAIPPRR